MRGSRGLVARLTVGLCLPAWALEAPAWAQGEDTEVASALDEADPFDLHLSVDYSYSARKAAIKRETAGANGARPDAPLPVARDLLFEQARHLVTPRVAVGIFHDIELYGALPITIIDTRTWELDRRASSCSGERGEPTCVDPTTSSTIRDGLLPGPDAPGGMGFDAEDPDSNFGAGDEMVFRGIDRKGLDQLHLGVNYAILNEERDDTKPTWVLGVETRLSIGKIARFDREDPSDEDGVSEGLHEIQVSTGFSRRLGWAEPFLYLWWRGPLGKRGDEAEDPSGTLFWDVGYGQGDADARHRAGMIFGFDAVPWSSPAHHQELAIVFRGRLEATFEGIGYSEMWEPFAYAGDRETNPGGPLVLDRDPLSDDAGALSHPGVTKIENYLTMGAALGLRGRLGERARFDTWFEASHDQAHRISFTDAGVEGSDSDNVITPRTAEVNPLHVRTIDLTGRRYVVEDTTVFTYFVSGSLLF